tara:strand:- start:8191 stop:8553 length:363 start_codon:yes stop_codon:yes gene_type:complete
MKIITAYPIIENGKLVGNKLAADTLNYSSAIGKKRKRSGKLKGLIGSGKVKGFLEKTGGVATGLATLLGGAPTSSQQDQLAPPVEIPKPPMSTTTKVLIGVGVAAVLGVGIYFVMKKKSK